MNDQPTDVAEDGQLHGVTGDALADDTSEGDIDFDDFPAETDEEIIAGLAESEEDVAAGRVRPLREAVRDIATRLGIQIED